jgi:hypothetical protein
VVDADSPGQVVEFPSVSSDYEIPPPEPKEIDEKNWMELKGFIERAVLRGEPYTDAQQGLEKCGNCLYYLNTDDSISYCWHPQIRILVGFEWWCQWWEKLEE